MNNAAIATVGDLIAALDRYDPATPVRFAIQSGHALEHMVARIACTPDDADGDGTSVTDPLVVWLGISEPIGYLPTPAMSALGWSR